MFDAPARFPLYGDRLSIFYKRISVVGVDLTGATYKMQVRDRPEGGTIRANLTETATRYTAGVYFVDVVTVDGVPTSNLDILISQGVMEVFPQPPEIGQPATFYWDVMVADADLWPVSFRMFEGEFIVEPKVTPA